VRSDVRFIPFHALISNFPSTNFYYTDGAPPAKEYVFKQVPMAIANLVADNMNCNMETLRRVEKPDGYFDVAIHVGGVAMFRELTVVVVVFFVCVVVIVVCC
jgi:hypothetical protein